MKQAILIVLTLALLTACRNREVVKYERVVIERVDTVVVVTPTTMVAVFDTITIEPQTREVDGGKVTIRRVVDKVYVECTPDTIIRTVQMERIIREKGKTVVVDKPSRWWLWLILGAVLAVLIRFGWRYYLRGL
jgi:hypothetical protein